MERSVEWIAGSEARIGGRAALNFASANYLGLDPLGWIRRPKRRRQPAPDRVPAEFSLAVPRGLAVSSVSGELEGAIADLVGAPTVVVRSTLHGLVDLLHVLLPSRGLLVIGKDAYRISRIAAEQAAGRGVTVVSLPTWRTSALGHVLCSCAGSAVVLCDSLKVPGALSPLPEIAAVSGAHGATVVVDDTQTFGLLGRRRRHGTASYGLGGAGALAYTGCDDPGVIQIASLSKALGVPLAFVAGPSAIVERLRMTGPLIWAGSPPDVLTCTAALHALRLHRQHGEMLRKRLAGNVLEFQQLTGLGGYGLFPIRTWYLRSADNAARAEQALMAEGVWAVLDVAPTERCGRAAIRFLLTANHDSPSLARAAAKIHRVRARMPR